MARTVALWLQTVSRGIPLYCDPAIMRQHNVDMKCTHTNLQQVKHSENCGGSKWAGGNSTLGQKVQHPPSTQIVCRLLCVNLHTSFVPYLYLVRFNRFYAVSHPRSRGKVVDIKCLGWAQNYQAHRCGKNAIDDSAVRPFYWKYACTKKKVCSVHFFDRDISWGQCESEARLVGTSLFRYFGKPSTATSQAIMTDDCGSLRLCKKY